MLCEMIYRRRSYEATMLIGQAIERLTLYADRRIALMHISLSDYEKYGAVKEDCDELINYAREIDGVEIALFLRETGEQEYKVSMRSKKYADVAKLAVQYGGGGHLHAAGFTFQGKLENAVKEIVDAAETLL
jgi:phosphoesterase RecJ-like protein